MQLDAEEDEHVFYKPPVEAAARPAAERRTSAEATPQVEPAAAITAEDDD